MIIAPSILACNFSDLDNEIKRIDQSSAEFVHLDVMDGKFVSNTTFDDQLIASIRPLTKKVFDVHLMMNDVENYIDDYIAAGSDYITFHIEAVNDEMAAFRLLHYIKSCDVKCGIAIKPDTPLTKILNLVGICDLVLVMSVDPGAGGQPFIKNSLQRIKEISEYRKKHKFQFLIEVDGGINESTSKLARDAGVDILVAGSYIFSSQNLEIKIKSLR